MIRLFIFLAFLLIVDIYSFQAIKTVSKKKVRLTYILVNGILYFLLFFQIFFIENVRESALLTYNFTLLFILFVSKTILMLFLFPEDILRVIKFLFSKIQNKKIDNSRRKFISNLSLAVAAIPIPIMIHGITRGRYNFKLVNHEISFKDLPESFDGYTITHLSDFHCGSLESRSKLKYAIDLVNEQNSDLIAFTGDFVNNTYTEILPWIDEFKKINSKDGKFSILGNHDYGDYMQWETPKEKIENMEALYKAHKDMGWNLLLNESRFIEKDGHRLAIVGVENWGNGFKQEGDLDKALTNVGAKDFKILMSHDPSHWEAKVLPHPYNIHLTLSGHTHGMQFGIEIPGWIKWSPVKWRYKQWAGIYEKAKQRLNVNRGFGYLAYPGRVGMWPEISVITLKKSKDAV